MSQTLTGWNGYCIFMYGFHRELTSRKLVNQTFVDEFDSGQGHLLVGQCRTQQESRVNVANRS